MTLNAAQQYTLDLWVLSQLLLYLGDCKERS